MVSSHRIMQDFAAQPQGVIWLHDSAVVEQEPRPRNSVPSFGFAGTDSNLLRRAEKRYQESATWQETATKIETALGLKTEHKA